MELIAIDVSPAEVRDGALSAAHREAALAALREDGVVVLNDVVDLGHLDQLKERMLADLGEILAREDAPFNFNTGNVQQDPPPFPPFLFRDILLNEPVIAVTRAVLGSGVKNSYYSGNTALPGGKRQPVHPDNGQLWPDLETAPPPVGLVVNIPIVDMSPENGSTELWPGTHRDTTFSLGDGSVRISEAILERRRAVRPPVQPAVRRGAAVIRDIRLWHAGMPNLTDIPRPMIAMIHWVWWWSPGKPLPFPQGTESFFEHPVLRTHARFVAGPIDYLRHNEAYDLQRG